MAVSVQCLQQLMEEAGCCEREAARLSYQLTQVSQGQISDIQGFSKLGCGLDVQGSSKLGCGLDVHCG